LRIDNFMQFVWYSYVSLPVQFHIIYLRNAPVHYQCTGKYINILNPATNSPNIIWTEHIPYTVSPAPVQVTAAPTADGIAVSWRWNGNISSVLPCIRSVRIIYQPVGDMNKSFDVPKSATRFTLRGQQCNMGCTIIIRTLEMNGMSTDKECTTLGRKQIWPKALYLLKYTLW